MHIRQHICLKSQLWIGHLCLVCLSSGLPLGLIWLVVLFFQTLLCKDRILLLSSQEDKTMGLRKSFLFTSMVSS